MDHRTFKAARLQLGLGLAQTAYILGVSIKTVQKWETPPSGSTARHVNPTAARVMGWLLDGFRPPEWPPDD